jgi:sugar lactone lactonase YvrE
MKTFLSLISIWILIAISSGCASPETLRLEVRTLNIPDKLSWEPFGIIERNGEIFVSDGENGRILRCSGARGFEVFAEGFETPSHLAFDSEGNLIVVDTGANTVVQLKGRGERTVIAGKSGVAGIGEGIATDSLLNGPIGIAIDGKRIFVSDTYNDRIVEIADGTLATIAGNGRGYQDGSSKEARFDTPSGLLILPDGALLIADTGNGSVRKMMGDGKITTIGLSNFDGINDGPLDGASFDEPVAFAREETGDILVLDGDTLRRINNQQNPHVTTLNRNIGGFQDGAISESRFSMPSGIAVASTGDILITDSANGLIRAYGTRLGRTLTPEEFHKSIPTPEEFRSAGPARWPFDPPQAPRDIAGTLGELRGAIGVEGAWRSFHNGLDIAGSYGEKTILVRDEKALNIISARFLGTNRELVRFPLIGYIHLRIGRDADEKPFDDSRFIFEFAPDGKPNSLRIKRGTRFSSGDVIGTLNSQNHVHLVTGRYGYEYNAIVALDLPGLEDTIPPTIESLEIIDIESGLPLIEPIAISNATRLRVIMNAWDRKNLNPERRRLGIFEAGYRISRQDSDVMEVSEKSISFRGMPADSAVTITYAEGSRSGATGVTLFRYIIGNRISVDDSREGSIDLSNLPVGDYNLTIYATDFFDNRTEKVILIRIVAAT